MTCEILPQTSQGRGVAAEWQLKEDDVTQFLGSGRRRMTYFMLRALLPLIAVVGIAVVFERWNSGRSGKRRTYGADRRKSLRL